ncbi:MAG: NADH-quinone oxidoreductase subunit M, partial [Thermomicrobiales bacterium]
MDFPILSAITFLPLVGALAILFIPQISKEMSRIIAMIAALGSFALSAVVLVKINPDDPFQAGKPVPFEEKLNWLSGLGASYHMGVDGIAALLIGLTTLLTVLAIGWSWGTVSNRPREYYIAILLLATGMLG